jgi:hypothetical protein
MSWLNYWNNWSISVLKLKAWGCKMMDCWCNLDAMFLHNSCVGFYTVLVCVSKDADCMLTTRWHPFDVRTKDVECTSFAAIWSHLALSPNRSEMKLLDIKQKLGLYQWINHWLLLRVKIMKWEVSLEVGSMAYSTNSYFKNADFYVFWDLKWVISST